jgi:hypothetical protein
LIIARCLAATSSARIGLLSNRAPGAPPDMGFHGRPRQETRSELTHPQRCSHTRNIDAIADRRVNSRR